MLRERERRKILLPLLDIVLEEGTESIPRRLTLIQFYICFCEFFVSRSLRRKLLTGIGVQGGIYLLSGFAS